MGSWFGFGTAAAEETTSVVEEVSISPSRDPISDFVYQMAEADADLQAKAALIRNLHGGNHIPKAAPPALASSSK